MITVIDKDYVRLREAIEARRTHLHDVKRNKFRVISLAEIKPSIDRSIRQPPSPPKENNWLLQICQTILKSLLVY